MYTTGLSGMIGLKGRVCCRGQWINYGEFPPGRVGSLSRSLSLLFDLSLHTFIQLVSRPALATGLLIVLLNVVYYYGSSSRVVELYSTMARRWRRGHSFDNEVDASQGSLSKVGQDRKKWFDMKKLSLLWCKMLFASWNTHVTCAYVLKRSLCSCFLQRNAGLVGANIVQTGGGSNSQLSATAGTDGRLRRWRGEWGKFTTPSLPHIVYVLYGGRDIKLEGNARSRIPLVAQGVHIHRMWEAGRQHKQNFITLLIMKLFFFVWCYGGNLVKSMTWYSIITNYLVITKSSI